MVDLPELRRTGLTTDRLREIVAPDAFIQNIALNPNETFSVDVQFELRRDYPLRRGPFPEFDLIQIGAPGDPDAIVGGQRFVLDFSKLVLVKSGDYWRYRDEHPGPAWTSPDYDDSRWKIGKAEFVFANNLTETRYLRHTFDVADPSFYRSLVLWLKRDDAAVVYLNGEIISRTDQRVRKINPRNLRRGKNVIAVVLRQNSPPSDDLKNLPRNDDLKNLPRRDEVSFDLELSANRADPGFSPDIAFAAPPDGALFQANEIVPVKLQAEALGDAKVQSVSLYVDGKLAGTAETTLHVQVAGGIKGIAPVTRCGHRPRSEAVRGLPHSDGSGECSPRGEPYPANGRHRSQGRSTDFRQCAGIRSRRNREASRVLGARSRFLHVPEQARRDRDDAAV